MQTETTTEIPQSDDTTAMSEIYPLRDVDDLSDEQQGKLVEVTQAAMRPLVEAEWAKRGYVTAWKAEPGQLDDELRETEIAVWGFAYDALDEDAVWAQL